MTNKTRSPRLSSQQAHRDTQETLYYLIRKQVKRANFPRHLIDADEIISEVFLLLVGRKLPDFTTEEFKKTLRETVQRVVWDSKRRQKPTLDISEIGDDEHPYYEMDFSLEEETFEFIFGKFCESFSEPKRTVYSRSCILSRWDIADLTGLSRSDIAKIMKTMPDDFRTFWESYRVRNTVR